jgi:hypothetical protein
MSSRQRFEIVSITALIAAILAFYALLTRPGVTWADDWATYIQDALNVLHGSRYDVTGYILNPDTNIGPSSYPPLYPLMLVLPVALWGVNFDAIHYTQLVGWAVFLLFVYFLTRRRLSFAWTLIVVAAVGLSPYFFAFKDYITSESLFLPLLYMTLVVAARFEERFPGGRQPVSIGIWIGLMLGLCILTRSIGIVLAPTLLGYDLLRFGRFRVVSVVAIVIAIVVFAMQFLLGDFLMGYFYGLRGYFVGLTDYFLGLGAAGGSQSDLTSSAPAIEGGSHSLFLAVASAAWHRISALENELSRFWGQGANGDLVARVATIVFLVLAAYGVTRIRRRGIMHCDIFALLYGAALVALPPSLASARMQLPLIPLFYTYVLMAVSSLSGQRNWTRRGGIAAVVVLGMVSYWHAYQNANFRAPLEGIETTNYHKMFDFIKTQTDPDSTFIFDKPRTLALYTGRRAAAIYGTRKGDNLLAYMHMIGARYILFYDGWYDGVPRAKYIDDYFGNHSGEFEALYDNGSYVLYKLRT